MTKLALLLLPALAACSTATTTAAPPAPPPAMAASPGTFPAGTYTATLVDADVPASAPADMRTGIVGPWEVTFDGNGHLTARFNGNVMVEGPYTINGSQINFGGDDTGEYACHSAATYNWHAAGNELHFQKVNDSCDGRAMAITSHAWTKRP
ncbi:MAG TPA: hypothetical protein VF092_09715 [Longimicrobium sp.]